MKHFRGRLVVFLASAILLSASVLAQNGGLRFTLTDLGTITGGTSSEAFAINDSGLIVGTFTLQAGGSRCFSVNLRNGVLLKFDGGSSPPVCSAFAVDTNGDIAGSTATPKTGLNYYGTPISVAFRYDNGGTLRILPLPPGGVFSFGLGITSRTVVGGVGDNVYDVFNLCFGFGQSQWDCGLHTAVRWDNSGGVKTIVTGSHTFSTYARGINRDEEIVGMVSDASKASGGPSPWLWQNGVLSDLAIGSNPFFTSDAWGDPEAINDSGFIAGVTTYPYPPSYSDVMCPVMWNSSSPATLPSILPNCPDLYAYIRGNAISNDNWVVGDYFLHPNYSQYPPFLSVPDPSCVLTNLNTLLDASGSGWTILTANGINSHHRIVGGARSPKDGSLHAVLLTPNNLTLCYPD